MSRSIDDVWTGLLALLPRGWVWSWARRKGSNVSRALLPLADQIATIEAYTDSLQDEIDPRTATMLLADYERVLGPDPCCGPAYQSIAQRRLVAFRRWTMSPGGQSAAYFIGLCAAQGVAATITEFVPSCAGILRAGWPTLSPQQSRIWRVNLPAAQLVPFRAGESVAGDSIGQIIGAGVECMLRRYAPADTVVIMNYAGS